MQDHTNRSSTVFPARPLDVIHLVAAAYQLHPTELTGHHRGRNLDAARRVAYRLLHDCCLISWDTAGDLMGRDGSTAAKGGRRADETVVDELTKHLAGQR